MRLPIRRGRAAALGVVLLLVWSAGVASAGVVAPPASDSELNELPPAAPAAGVMPALAIGHEPQPFWYPGADDHSIGDVAISAVPVRAADSVGTVLPGTQQHPLIPLPASAWTGMAGLLGLGAVKLLRNARRLLS